MVRNITRIWGNVHAVVLSESNRFMDQLSFDAYKVAISTVRTAV